MLWVHTDSGRSANGLERLNQMQNLEIQEMLSGDQDNKRYRTTSMQEISQQAIVLIMEGKKQLMQVMTNI